MSARKFDLFSGATRFGNVTVWRDDLRDLGIQRRSYAVILHQTAVLKFEELSGTITLNSGGWLTKTTKTAINEALAQVYARFGTYGSAPAVYQFKGQWYVAMPNGERLDFVDGMTLPLDLVNNHSVKVQA